MYSQSFNGDRKTIEKPVNSHIKLDARILMYLAAERCGSKGRRSVSEQFRGVGESRSLVIHWHILTDCFKSSCDWYLIGPVSRSQVLIDCTCTSRGIFISYMPHPNWPFSSRRKVSLIHRVPWLISSLSHIKNESEQWSNMNSLQGSSNSSRSGRDGSTWTRRDCH